jgi:GT2 family glycosyltransferase
MTAGPAAVQGGEGAVVPRVSVVLPTYNRATLVGRAIRSALAQTVADLELIVVDDGSADRTEAVLREVRDPRLRVLRLPGNRGVSRARNAGIDLARAPWVAFLDSDDEWRPAMLERQLARAAADPAIGAVYCRYHRHDHVTGRRATPALPLHEGDVLDRLLEGWRFVTSVAMVRRQALLDAGGFAPDLDAQEDYDMWLRLAARGLRFAAVAEALVIKHHHGDGHLSGDPSVRPRCLAVLDARWGPLVRARRGPAAYRRWRGDMEQRIHFARFMLVRLAGARGDRRAAWRGCLMLLRSPWAAGRFLAQAVILATLGRGPYRLLARMWNRATPRGAAQ